MQRKFTVVYTVPDVNIIKLFYSSPSVVKIRCKGKL